MSTSAIPGQREAAIADLSLEVPAGEVCVLVGPSGSGKTTAMRLINRMIPLTSGDILLGGRSVLEREPDELRREIGYVIQQIGLFPHQTIGENIATVPRLLGWDKAADRRARARAARADRRWTPRRSARATPRQLSGGQRQRVGVARALAADPPLMLMDEPFGAIDPINRARLQDEFLRAPGAGTQDGRVRHPRHRRGDQDGGPHRDPARGRRARPVRHARGAAQRAGRRVRRRVRRRRPRAQAPRAGDARRHRAAVAQRPAPAGDRVPCTTSVRDALSRMLAGGGAPLTVVDEDGEVAGLVTLELVGGLLGDAAGSPRADDGRLS